MAKVIAILYEAFDIWIGLFSFDFLLSSGFLGLFGFGTSIIFALSSKLRIIFLFINVSGWFLSEI
ncbi:hypothetical protein NW063_00820 [Mycoplasmopsis cynos]|uniref:hypothetical protein n=1 Tax=Mycoplasmopsis cynos TaxID=171284 RepID=UPI0022085FD2|nr:hypothetical protein [Mycoplasmopsis cynos]UWV86294.1 hypothetical protein NW063_00820 [Mycoplasmopsis cynos]